MRRLRSRNVRQRRPLRGQVCLDHGTPVKSDSRSNGNGVLSLDLEVAGGKVSESASIWAAILEPAKSPSRFQASLSQKS